MAIMGTLATVPLFVIALENRASEGLLISFAALAVVWAPRYLRQRAGRPVNGGQQERVADRYHPLR